MNWTALYLTLGLCLVSIIIEAVSFTKEGKRWFEQLQQPKFSIPLSVWYVVGGLYYLICGTIAYRQFDHSSNTFSLPVILLVTIMLINVLSNFVLFKWRSLKLFFLALFPFIILFTWLCLILFQTDKTSFWLAGIYLLWLIYDVYCFKKSLETE